MDWMIKDEVVYSMRFSLIATRFLYDLESRANDDGFVAINLPWMSEELANASSKVENAFNELRLAGLIRMATEDEQMHLPEGIKMAGDHILKVNRRKIGSV